MSSERKNNSRPSGPGPRVAEKPKDFKNAVKRLFNSLGNYKILIFISLVLAAISSILSLISPNKISSLTDEISKGIGINEANMSELSEDLTAILNQEKISNDFKEILALNIDRNTLNEVNSSNLSDDEKRLFQDTISKIQSDNTNTFKYLGELSDETLSIILKETTYNNIKVSVDDKISLIRQLKDLDIENIDYSFVSKIPININKILFPNSKIKDVEVTTEDKVAFISTMSKISEDTPTNEIYSMIGELPNSIQKLINPSMDMGKIKKITVFLIIIYIVSAVFTYIEGISMVKVANRFAKKLRSYISTKVNRLPLKFFDHSTIGDILSRVTNDVDTIAQSLNQSLASLVSATTLFLGSIIMMFITNYIMAITAIVASLLGFVLMFIILGKSQKYFTARQEELGNLNGHIEEMYSGLNVIKTYNGKEEAEKKFDELNLKVYECNRKSQFLSGLMQPIMFFVGNLGYVSVCVVGALLVSNNVISFGVIVAFIMYVRLFTNPLSQIAQSMTSIQTTAAASERVFEFLDEEEMSSQRDIKKKLDRRKVKGKIEFQNVRFGYEEDKIIIKDFTATAKPGQKIAIVGPTGAGKTTMVNLLMKFYEINSGDIKIDGVSTKELTRENIHSLFTMVLQDTWLFNGTIRENIVYNRKNVSDKRVREVCETVGVDHFIKTLPNGYDSVITDNDSVSAGQRQLLTIARGMIEDSPFLILDEATSNVDTRTEELVQKAMDHLMENRTSFIIAHRLSTIKNADLILVMDNGNIIEQGTHKELLKKNGFYAKLYNSQFEKSNS